MSDIQRYYVWNLHHTVPDQQSVVVLYDDHIAEADGWKKKVGKCVDSKLELQARINELEVTNSMLHDMISGMKRTTNEIQAQGIKEMLCDNNYEESTGWIEEYADKLEAKQ